MRRSTLPLFAAAAILPVALLPLIRTPVLVLVALGAAAAAALASRSPAYPLALAALPSAVVALIGRDPLPKGGVAVIVLGWITLSIVIWLVRTSASRVATPTRFGLGPSTIVVLLSLALAVVMVVRLGASPVPTYGTQKLELFVTGALPALAAATIVSRDRADFDLYLGMILLIFVFTAGALFIQLAGHHATAVFSGRYSLSSQENPIEIGRETGIGLLVAVYVVVASPKPWIRLFGLAVLPLLAVGLIASGSRGPVVGVTLALIAFLALAGKDRVSRRRVPVIVVGGLLALVLVGQLVPGQASNRALSVLTGTGAGVSSNGRSELWSQAISAFDAHSLQGIGTGGFAALNPLEVYPHNLVLEVASELGLLGLIPLVGIFVSGATVLIGNWRRLLGADRARAALVIALFISALTNAMFSGDISTNTDIWLTLGLGIGLAQKPLRVVQASRPLEVAPIGA